MRTCSPRFYKIKDAGLFGRTSRRFVGGDAYIAPLETLEFAEDFRKKGLYCRVDVGIDPYAFVENRRKNRIETLKSQPAIADWRLCVQLFSSIGRRSRRSSMT